MAQRPAAGFAATLGADGTGTDIPTGTVGSAPSGSWGPSPLHPKTGPEPRLRCWHPNPAKSPKLGLSPASGKDTAERRQDAMGTRTPHCMLGLIPPNTPTPVSKISQQNHSSPQNLRPASKQEEETALRGTAEPGTAPGSPEVTAGHQPLCPGCTRRRRSRGRLWNSPCLSPAFIQVGI